MCRIEQDHDINALTTGPLNRTQFGAATRILNSGDIDAQKRWEAYQRALETFGVPR